MKKGHGVEDLVKNAHWKDFEGIVSEVFSTNGFKTLRNFRFSSNKKRYEIDVIALERPYIIFADCKHWGLRIGKGSALKAASLNQLRRAKELIKKLQEFPQIDVGSWNEIKAIPLLVTLYEERICQNEGVLIVPIFRLNTFVEEMRSCYFDSISPNVVTLKNWIKSNDAGTNITP